MKKLGEVQDDTETFTVEVAGVPPPEGNAQIENLNYPSEVNPGQSFNVTYTARNIGGTDTLWGRIIDRDTGQVIPGSEWQQMISGGSTKNVSTQFSGITADFHGRVEAGHIE